MVHERLIIFREYLGLNRIQFAQKVGIPRATYYKIEEGKKKISHKDLSKIVLNTEINSHWLLTGQGNMLRQAEKPEDHQHPDMEARLMKRIEELLEARFGKIGTAQSRDKPNYPNRGGRVGESG